ncbi:unnamed protein product [Blepharisma stoltei]|uniref:F-box domain-containing protein n=1 Tax=Blepharisma stoltei TaxID=1481888 RepID=A0AAU9JL00_9CILI|nr:unnamed protein product [Blepharisma stoltei]
MNKIPDPVLAEILTAVGHFSEINNLASVCKRWLRLLKKAGHHVSFEGTFNPTKLQSSINIGKYLRIFTSRLKILSLSLRNITISSAFEIQLLAEALVFQSSWLETLDLTNNDDFDLALLWTTVLDLLDIKAKKNINCVFTLKTLKITNYHKDTKFYLITKIFPNLQKFYAGNSEMNLNDFKYIIENLKYLELLDVSYCTFIINASNVFYNLKELLEGLKLKIFIGDCKFGALIDLQQINSIELIKTTIHDILSNLENKWDLLRLEEFLNKGGDVNLFKYNQFGKRRKKTKSAQIKLIKKLSDSSLLEETFSIMIRYGLDLNFFSNSSGHTLLNWAIKFKRQGLVEMLLNARASTYTPNWSIYEDKYYGNWPSLLYALRVKNTEILPLFFKFGLEKFDYFNLNTKFKCNPLCLTIRKSTLEAYPKFINEISPNYRCSDDAHMDEIILLLKNSQGINKYPLNWVYNATRRLIVSNWHYGWKLGFIQYLVSYNIQNMELVLISPEDYKNMVARPLIMLAAYKGDLDILTYLLDNGFDINNRDNYKRNALFDAIAQENLEMVRKLCEFGININNQDRNGETPLHQAMKFQNIEIIKELIKNGADLSIKSNSGLDSQFYAMKYRLNEILGISTPTL